MTKYEYKIVNVTKSALSKSTSSHEANLNNLGSEGWKVVGVVAPVLAGSSTEISYTLMRELH